MVNSESEVLPSTLGMPPDDVLGHNEEQGAAQGLDEDGEDDALSEVDGVESLFRPRASRPSNDDGWLDYDHYSHLDAPADSYADGEWRERDSDLDEIQVNGAIRRQWKKGVGRYGQGYSADIESGSIRSINAQKRNSFGHSAK